MSVRSENRGRSVFILWCGASDAGHSHPYRKAWKSTLEEGSIPYQEIHFKTSRNNPNGRWRRFVRVLTDILYATPVWVKMLSRIKYRDHLICMDSIASWPVAFRYPMLLLIRLRKGRGVLMACHAFPEGGDRYVNPERSHKWKAYFCYGRIMAHSERIRQFLRDEMEVHPERILETTWGCDPPTPALSGKESKDLIRLLIFGQYRSTKGIEWAWEEMQKMEIPCLLKVWISCPNDISLLIKNAMKESAQNSIHTLEYHSSAYFDDTTVSKAFDHIDLLVIPYLPEHVVVSGLVYQAAQMGVPVLSSSHSESGWIPSQTGFGYTFAPGDAESFREQLRTHSRTDLHQRNKMRQAAIEFCEKNQWRMVLGNVCKRIGIR